MGMSPVGPEVGADVRRQLGDGITDLAGGRPDAIIAIMRGVVAERHRGRRGDRTPRGGSLRRWCVRTVGCRHCGARATHAVSHPVEPDWVDYNDHMTEAADPTAAGWASDGCVFRYIGDDEA